MHLANTKYSFEFKATPCISHIFLCGSQHLGSLCGALEGQQCCLCSSCAGHGHICIKGLRSRPTLLSRGKHLHLRCHDGFVLIPSAPVSSQRKGGCPAGCHPFAVCIPAPLHQQQGVHREEGGAELSRVSEQRHPAHTGTAQPLLLPPEHQHTATLTRLGPLLPREGSTGSLEGHGKLKGLLLRVAGRAENFLLSPGLALKPFSVLLSADVLQRCKT